MILNPETIQQHHEAMQQSLEQMHIDEALEEAKYLSSTRIARVLQEAPAP